MTTNRWRAIAAIWTVALSLLAGAPGAGADVVTDANAKAFLQALGWTIPWS